MAFNEIYFPTHEINSDVAFSTPPARAGNGSNSYSGLYYPTSTISVDEAFSPRPARTRNGNFSRRQEHYQPSTHSSAWGTSRTPSGNSKT